MPRFSLDMSHDYEHQPCLARHFSRELMTFAEGQRQKQSN